MSLMYNRNKRGPSTLPWGTPHLTFKILDNELFMITMLTMIEQQTTNFKVGWFLMIKIIYQQTAKKIKLMLLMGKKTISRIISETTKAISTVLQSTYMSPPSCPEDWKKNSYRVLRGLAVCSRSRSD